MIKNVLIAIALMLAPFISEAQLISYDQLDTCRMYHSMESALKNPDKVYRLDLSKQKLKAFPDSLALLKNLNVLILDKNKITEIPAYIGKFKYLQKLSIQYNQVDTIRPEVLWLQNLQVLDLGYNFVSYIPDQISKLTQLRILSMWDNPIAYYPNTLGDLEHLEVFDLLNNQMGRDTQRRVTELLPNTRVIMSPPCHCQDGQ